LRVGGREPPREIFLVKLDIGQQIGLEIGDIPGRKGADDGTVIQSRDVAGAVELHFFGARGRIVRGAARLVGVSHDQLNVEGGAFFLIAGGSAEGVFLADFGSETLAEPREECVVG
jgi:hypothetical protein